MLWSFGDLDLTLGSLNHYARNLDVTLKPQRFSYENFSHSTMSQINDAGNETGLVLK